MTSNNSIHIMTLVYPKVIHVDNLDQMIAHFQNKVSQIIQTNCVLSNVADSAEPVVMDHCRLSTNSLNKQCASLRKIKDHTSKLAGRYIASGVSVGYDRVNRPRSLVNQAAKCPTSSDDNTTPAGSEAAGETTTPSAAVYKRKASPTNSLTRKIYPSMQTFNRDMDYGDFGDFMMVDCFKHAPLEAPPLEAKSNPLPPKALKPAGHLLPETYIDMSGTVNKAATASQTRPSAPPANGLDMYVDSKLSGGDPNTAPVTMPPPLSPFNHECFWDVGQN